VLKVIRYTWKVLKCVAGEKWKDRVRNKGLHRSNEEMNIMQTIKRRKAN